MSPKAPKKTFSDLKAAAQKGLANIDVDALKDKAAGATSIMVEKAGELKDAAVDVKDDIAAKLTELDRMLQESVTEYNDAYTIMNDKGVQLYIERCRSLDSISFVESWSTALPIARKVLMQNLKRFLSTARNLRNLGILLTVNCRKRGRRQPVRAPALPQAHPWRSWRLLPPCGLPPPLALPLPVRRSQRSLVRLRLTPHWPGWGEVHWPQAAVE